MRILADFIIGLIALEHLGFLVLEMFFWRGPIGLRIFRMTQSSAEASAKIAANQGLYNGFLSAGLAWGLWSGLTPLKVFFLSCVAIAGVFGGLTVNRRVFLIQALPAAIALGLLWQTGL